MSAPRLLRRFAWILPALAAGASGAEVRSRFECSVTSTEVLERLGPNGGPAELMRFSCRVTGGLLDGYLATGTSIWGGQQRDGVLLGSLVVALKGDSVVVYELTQVTRRPRPSGTDGQAWEGAGNGIYKLATGPAMPLAGRTFRSVSRSAGPGAFTIETVVEGN